MNGGLANYRPGRCMYQGLKQSMPYSVMPLDLSFTFRRQTRLAGIRDATNTSYGATRFPMDAQ